MQRILACISRDLDIDIDVDFGWDVSTNSLGSEVMCWDSVIL